MCVRVYIFVYMHAGVEVCLCVNVCVNGWCVREEKAHLSLHAQEPCRVQLAVQLFFNEEHI